MGAGVKPGGGLDLVFPHHENEVAQSESATGKPFARVWMHNGLVLRDGEKMSKSIGNVISAREALERWSADAIRLFVLSSHYRSPNNVTEAAIDAATRSVARIANALREGGHDADALGGLIDDLSELQSNTETLATPSRASTDGSQERAEFVVRLEDDFNTAQALATVFGLVRSINTMRDAGEDVRPAQAVLRELTGILGLTLEERAADLDVVALSKLAKQFSVACGGTDAESTIEALLAHREEARKTRDFATADGIRDGLASAGVEVEDTPAGPRWSAR